MSILDILNQQFRAHIALYEKRHGVQQLFAPLFHEDGDMMDIFLDVPRDFQVNGAKTIRISDHGMTIMRTSYSFEIDTLRIPDQVGHRFRSKLATHSGMKLATCSGAKLATFSLSPEWVANMTPERPARMPESF